MIAAKKGFDVHRKFIDALDYCRKVKKKKFPENFWMEIEKFKSGIKKELRVSKGAGELEEKESDPIAFDMFHQMCQYAISTGNSFFWAYGLMQWSCMARCQNIDDLSFRDIAITGDAIKVQFNVTKTDKTGERCSPKHCYGNPVDYRICLNTALGVYLCLKNDSWTHESNGYIFLNNGGGKNTASSRYTNAIRFWVEDQRERLKAFARPDHINGHSMRKGSATFSSSGSTVPPPLPSIFHRGEWSLGVILDIYWKYAESGDFYLGRILAGLDPESSNFGILPPHFTVGNENEFLKKGIQLCFGKILETEGTNSFLVPVLTRCLASLVFHSQSLLKVVAKNTGHPFGNIKLFHDEELLKQLKDLVTIEKTPGVLSCSTGVPPHARSIKILEDVLKLLKDSEQKREESFKEFKTSVQKVVQEAIEKKFEANGHVSALSISNLLETYHQESVRNLNEKMRILTNKINLGGSVELTDQPFDGTEVSVRNQEIIGTSFYDSFNHSGKLGWAVPQDFVLPCRTNLRVAWGYWIQGNHNYLQISGIGENESIGRKKIRPFFLFNAMNIPCWKQFNTGWVPILKMMTRAPQLSGLSEEITNGNVTIERVEASFEIGLNFVLSQVSYIKKTKNHRSWTITTWSKKITYSSIIKNGTNEDKEKLPPVTRFNSPHQGKRKMKQSNSRQAAIRFRLTV